MTAPETAAERLARIVPDAVVEVLGHLHASGHAGYVVGGSLRDALLGRDPADWDLATDALPDQLVKLFHGAVYENRFGTVAIRRDDDVFEATTFRTEHDYADFRRPHRVEFGTDVIADLARRDFTVNAIAWGREAAGDGPNDLVDPFDGIGDLGRHLLRAVGDPGARFREDALRMVRAVRLAAALEFDDRAGDAGGHPGQRRPRRPSLRRTDRGRAREAARGAEAIHRPPPGPGDGAARRDRTGPRGPGRDRPEQGAR